MIYRNALRKIMIVYLTSTIVKRKLSNTAIKSKDVGISFMKYPQEFAARQLNLLLNISKFEMIVWKFATIKNF